MDKTAIIAVIVAVLIASFFIGFFARKIYDSRKEVETFGTIRIDRSDPDDNPYLFLELDEEGLAFMNRDTATFRVLVENYIKSSQD